MSLIVVRQVICPVLSILIIGDTRLSKKRGKYIAPEGPDSGVIKTSIIHKNLSISWVGNSDLAKQFFKNNIQFLFTAKKEEILNKTSIFDFNDEIDFIICFGNSDNQNEEIVSIKNGRIERDCPFAWIGSQDAYNEFNKKYLSYINDYEQRNTDVPGTVKKNAMLQSMREVIIEQKDPTVGDFVYEVFYSLNNCEFIFQSGYIISPNTSKKRLSVGNAADGDYSICSGADPNNHYYAIYLYQIRAVWIWGAPEGGYMKAIKKISCLSISECEKILKNDYQIKMNIDVFREFKNE